MEHGKLTLLSARIAALNQDIEFSMLNSDALNQLSQLKSEIIAAKDIATGTVIGTKGKFGFVRLSDGRDAFLSPEKMNHVFPGDEVTVNVVKKDNDKFEAEFEKFVSSPTQRFIGFYRTKGKTHFVQPDISNFNRWIFLPPNARGKCSEGDLVVAKVTRHPYKTGKPQAKILERIGREDDSKIEHKFIRAKYDLNRLLSDKALEQAKSIGEQIAKEDYGDRQDLTSENFVTIDSAATRDMDDALSIQKTENGFQLSIAIADPSNFVHQQSPLAHFAQDHGQTVYLLGGSVPMLPAQLANNCFSLEANKVRPALICKVQLDLLGEISSFEFSYAKIKSRHKLTYDEVAEFIQDKKTEAIPEDSHELISNMYEFAQARHQFREKHYLLGNDQDDFDYQLDDNGKIENISVKPKNAAHRLVEESMLLINYCAGKFLSDKNIGISTTHGGFRPDRIGEVKALLNEEGIKFGDLETRDDFVALIKSIENNDEKRFLISPLRRLMQYGELTLTGGKHFGLGMDHYCTVSSPIRRFVDLYNHWAIRFALQDGKFSKISADTLNKLNETLQSGKLADRELYQWLVIQYVEKLLGQEATGTIKIVTQQGFGVKLNDNGIEGFILFDKNKDKKYDAKRMTITVDDVCYALDKQVNIKIDSVDKVKRRIAFTLA